MYNLEVIKSELPYYQEIMLFYKVNPCTAVPQKHSGSDLTFNNQACNQPSCFGYHNINERRRPVFDEETPTLLYQPVKCASMTENGACAKGDFCKFSHTQNEIMYHPLFYKTESCSGCMYENNIKFCPYYHSDEASRKVNLDKFKAKMNKEVSKTQQNIPGTGQAPFDLDNFKANPCPFKGNHNPKVCDYYHHDKDRKRPVSVFNYSSNLCPYASKDCPNGDNCNHCHNKVEQLYHPDRYKRKFCLCHPHNVHKCEYGDYCSFAHSETEIQIELLHNLKKDENFYLYKYKTVFCPYIYDHDRNQCVYAHNSQDFRRDPSAYKYDPVQCPFWSQGQIFSYEEGACPKQMECNNCHGWKELEFHPLYYKTKPCNNGKKCNKKDCPFYHSNAEKREKQAFKPMVQNFPTFQLSNTPTTQQKSVDFGTSDMRMGFEPPKSKFHKKTESHYARPIVPVYVPVNKGNDPQEGSHVKAKRLQEPSTRPNSNISSVYFSGEDAVRVVPKKKKGKRMSLQNKNEKLASPISAKSDKPKGQGGKDASAMQINIWEAGNQENQERFDTYFTPFEPNKPKSRGNDSFDSLQSYTVEKNVVTSEKQTEIANDQFVHTLFANLERKGLEHTVQYLKNANLDADSLKSLSAKDYHLFPQISLDDKERIVKIIQDIIEEEAILSEINTVNEGGLATSLNQNTGEEGSFPANPGAYSDSHDFHIATLLQKYS